MTNDTKPLRYCELDIKPCSLTYGVAPCTAVLGDAEDYRCYNSPRTCQDPPNYTEGSVQVIRWAEPTEDLPVDIEAIPSIKGISTRPMTLDIAEGLGVRESVNVSFRNHRDNDYLFDKYPDTRTENAYSRGTFWGKFMARWGNIEGYAFRVKNGILGEDIASMETRHYVIDSVNGPTSNGDVSFVAKDIMKFTDKDKAQWPRPSNGQLSATLTDVGTSITLKPTGIGAEYPASGTASIGDEKVTYTRSGDVITLTGRGLSGTPQEEHDIDETFQEGIVYSSLNPAEIINDLLVNATQIPVDWLDFAAWDLEVNSYLQRNYSTEILQPTSVSDLIKDLSIECGITFYADVVTKKLVLKVLRQDIPVLSLTDDTIISGSISAKKLKDKRISEVWVYFGRKNPLEQKSEKKNYTSIYVDLSGDPVVALEDSPSAIRDILSRYITTPNQAAASSLTNRLLSRYENIPRQIGLKVPSNFPMTLHDTVTVQSHVFEDAQGDLEAPINCQITKIENTSVYKSIIAEEVIFQPVNPPSNVHAININVDTYNINLRNLHDTLYSSIQSGDTVEIIIADTATIGSTSTAASTYALNIGSWPAGVTIKIIGNGRIQGKGGDATSTNGGDGGRALFTSYPIIVEDNLEIYGGGGAGATEVVMGTTVTGGGGAGNLPGTPGATTENGGASLNSGGDPGLPGEDALPNLGGAAGVAIQGVSNITFNGTPDIKGAQLG